MFPELRRNKYVKVDILFASHKKHLHECRYFNNTLCIIKKDYLVAGMVKVSCKVPSNFFLQLRRPATALRRKFLHDLTTARHFKSASSSVFERTFKLRGNNSVCAGAFSYCAAAHPRSLEETLVMRVRGRTAMDTQRRHAITFL